MNKRGVSSVESPDCMALGFENVDGGGARAHVDYLELAAKMDARRRTAWYPLLGIEAGSAVLDVGAGTGAALFELGDLVSPGGHVAGIDLSHEMVVQCSAGLQGGNLPGAASATVCQADAGALPFIANSFDAGRADRVLQHLVDPLAALRELSRVVRLGGRVAVSDVDRDMAGADEFGGIADVLGGGVVQPRIGRQLRRLFVDAGLGDIMVMPTVFELTDFDAAVRLRRVEDRAEVAIAAGRINRADFESWVAETRWRSAEGRYAAYIVMFTVVGTVES